MEKRDEASITPEKILSIDKHNENHCETNVHCVSVGKGDTVAKHTLEAKYKCTSRL
jgi:hypothetical protein